VGGCEKENFEKVKPLKKLYDINYKDIAKKRKHAKRFNRY